MKEPCPYSTIDINPITMRAFVHRTRWANTPTTLVGKFSLARISSGLSSAPCGSMRGLHPTARRKLCAVSKSSSAKWMTSRPNRRKSWPRSISRRLISQPFRQKQRSMILKPPRTKPAPPSCGARSRRNGMWSMPRWPSSIASVFSPQPLQADGHASVKVASRFGTLQLNRQVFAPLEDGAHVLPGNAVLPPHQGMIITRGLQELACLLPQDLSFETVTRLLSWQTQDDQVLSDTTVRALVRTHGQIIRQAEQAEVAALLAHHDLTTLRPQLIPPQQPRRRAAWPVELTAAVDAALIVGATRPPPGVTTADWERVLAVRR